MSRFGLGKGQCGEVVCLEQLQQGQQLTPVLECQAALPPSLGAEGSTGPADASGDTGSGNTEAWTYPDSPDN